ELGLDAREKTANGRSDLDRIGSSAPEDRDHDRRRRNVLAAHPEAHLDALVLERVLDNSNILDAKRCAIGLADDEIFVLACFAQLALRLEQERAARAVQLSRAGVRGPALD